MCSGHEEKGKDEVEEELNFSLDTPTLLVGGGEEGEGEEGEGGRKESETRTKPESRNKTMNATVLTFFYLSEPKISRSFSLLKCYSIPQ